VFTPAERDRVRGRVLELAAADERVVAGAAVGSLANGGGDRFSDLDLTFGVDDGVAPAELLDDWGRELERVEGAARLFDVSSGPTVYRVFLLPGCLQLDLSCTPAAAFGAGGPRWELLFGRDVEPRYAPPPDAGELFGLGVHHAVRARFCIERGRVWQAEYWIGEARDQALALACRRRGLPAHHARGFDELPAAVLAELEAARVGSLDRDELLRALGQAVAGLLREADEARELADRVEGDLCALVRPGRL
jgi:hypothetical protein